MRLKGENLAFRHPKACWLFENLTIEIASGEIVGLTGPSGCGKTTLGRVLGGYLRPEKGSITIDSEPLPLTGFQPVQVVFQHPEQAVNPRWKLRKTLYEGGTPSESLLQELSIEKHWLERWPNELSGGELQRICIARALAGDTRFLIADEMTTMLDAITQAQIWNAVLSIAKERQIGILVISHDPHLIERLCDRVIHWEEVC